MGLNLIAACAAVVATAGIPSVAASRNLLSGRTMLQDVDMDVPKCGGECAGTYDKCDGKDFDAPLACCEPDYVCYVKNDDYSQCRPMGDSPLGWYGDVSDCEAGFYGGYGDMPGAYGGYDADAAADEAALDKQEADALADAEAAADAAAAAAADAAAAAAGGDGTPTDADALADEAARAAGGGGGSSVASMGAIIGIVGAAAVIMAVAVGAFAKHKRNQAAAGSRAASFSSGSV